MQGINKTNLLVEGLFRDLIGKEDVRKVEGGGTFAGDGGVGVSLPKGIDTETCLEGDGEDIERLS